MLGYVLTYRPLSLDGSLVTSGGRRFFFTAKPDDTALRGGDWVHFEPIPRESTAEVCARIIARAHHVAPLRVSARDAANLLAALAGESLSEQPA